MGVQKKAVFAWLDELYEAGLPLPELAGYPGQVDHLAIRRCVNPDGPCVQTTEGYAEKIRRHRADGGPGVAPAARDRAEEHGPTVAEVFSEIRELMAGERAAKGRDPAGGQYEMATALNRVMAARALTEDEPCPSDLFADVSQLATDACLAGKPLSEGGARNLKTFVTTAARLSVQAAEKLAPPADDLPLSPHDALREAILRSRKTLVELEIASTVPGTNQRIPATLLTRLQYGQAPFPEKHWKSLHHLELALGTNGALAKRFTPSTRIDHLDCTPYFRTIRWKIRALLPPGSHLRTDEEVRLLVKEREDKVLRQDRAYSKCIRISKEINKHMPKLPADAPVRREIDLLVAHKTAAIPEDARRRPNTDWSAGTVRLQRARLEILARFAMMPIEKGGLGKAAADVSLAIIMNWKVLAALMDYRAARFAHVVHANKRRGPVLTAYDVGIVSLCISLLDHRYGWVKQRKDLFGGRVLVDENEVRAFTTLEELRILHRKTDDAPKQGFEVFDEAFSTAKIDRRICPPELHAAFQRDWSEACDDAHSQLANLQSYLIKLVDRSRDPFEAISVIVYDEDRDPLSFVRDIVRAAQADLPDRASRPYDHAVAVRDLLMFTMLALTALRSSNIRNLRYCKDGGGHVSFTKDGILLTIPWWEFKNLGSVHLFGPWSNKTDYQRLVKDWYNVEALFQHYLKHCLPYLVTNFADKLRHNASEEDIAKGLPSDTTALFPGPNLTPMSDDDFCRVCHELTAHYHVLDSATKHVRPGYMPFGPHAMRDIVAMHIVLASEDDARWEEAADLLQTSPEMVRYRYTRRLVVKRTAKADKHFDKSSRGFGEIVFS